MYRDRVSVGGHEVAVGAMCPNETKKYGFQSWSLRGLQSRRDAEKWSFLITGLRTVLSRMGVHKAYAPNVGVFSAEIVDSRALGMRINLGANIVLHRDRSVPADGVLVRKGHAFVMSGAGCPVVVAVGDELMIIAHAGLRSLIDRGAVKGEPTRGNMSVVNAIVDALGERGVTPERIAMCMLFSIPTMAFEYRLNHPQYGHYNRALSKFIRRKWPSSARENNNSMFLDLESLFEEQARQVCVRNVRSEKSLVEFPCLAHTYDGQDSFRRNLIVVKRC